LRVSGDASAKSMSLIDDGFGLGKSEVTVAWLVPCGTDSTCGAELDQVGSLASNLTDSVPARVHAVSNEAPWPLPCIFEW
jgi:hypothetical protein